MKSNSKICLVLVILVLIGIIVTVCFSYPPKLYTNRAHLFENKSAFLGIASFLEANKDVERISLDGESVVHVSVAGGGDVEEFSAETLEALVNQMQVAAVNPVQREGQVTLFYAGFKSRFYRKYEVQVVHSNAGFDNEQGVDMPSCTRKFGLASSSGQCVDKFDSSLLIHYSWAPK